MARKRFHKKVTAMVTRKTYQAIEKIIQTRRERFRNCNPPMREWSDKKMDRAFEACSVSGVIREGIELLIKKEVKENAVLSTSKS